MVAIFSICQELQKSLKLIKGKNFIDFRIFLRKNENLYIYILKNTDTNENELIKQIENIFLDVEVEFVDDLSDDFYKNIFESKNEIHIESGRRRFDSLLDSDQSNVIKSNTCCPIITFYSYKGGMGRSTTLAAFAMHLSMHEKYNVIIIDCDLEAPGFTNFYLKNSGEENQRPGFVEYFIDKSTNISTKENLESYLWEIGEEYSGEGTIRVMPAGNLNTSVDTNDFLNSNLNHYLEGLARIDFSDENYIIEKFKELVSDLNDEFKPDIILIDSRTGFSDIMGVVALNLSKIVVGFFRNDEQSLPGLNFFLQNVVKRSSIEPVLVNSILPSSISTKRQLYNQFKTDVKSITTELSNDEGLDFPCFPISRNENLEVIGTSSEVTEDFIELIKNKEIRDFTELFESLTERLKDLLHEMKIKDNTEESVKVITSKENLNLPDTPPGQDKIKNLDENTKVTWTKDIKNKILISVKHKLENLDLYGDNIDIEKEFNNKQFFFRTCMNDLFNIDKVLILGGKGTGKSYIYNSLKNPTIVAALKDRAKKQDNYTFVYMIDKYKRIFRVNKFEISDNKRFQYRFWLVYSWQILRTEISKHFVDFIPDENIIHISIKDDDTTRAALERIINDDKMILLIEKDFDRLDTYLTHINNPKKEYITIIYDQLDEIVDPSLWNYWLPSLIDFWRFKRYNRIFGKLFVRKDLFRKLLGITNINDLENQAIDIEWQQEEIFAYFFKIVFSNGMHDWFWAIMYLYGDFDSNIIRQLRPKYNNLEQMPLDEYSLRPLATTFFGKNVDVSNTIRMGESYDWFYKNLKNADDTISIRPFIELIKFAIDLSLDQHNIQKSTITDPNFNVLKPILYPMYYTDKGARIKAVENHFDDLSREVDNKPLTYIFDFVSNNFQYKSITLSKYRFENLIEEVLSGFSNEAEMKNQTRKSLEDLLITNGIVKKVNHGKGDQFKFAYLYKYKLGLKGS